MSLQLLKQLGVPGRTESHVQVSATQLHLTSPCHTSQHSKPRQCRCIVAASSTNSPAASSSRSASALPRMATSRRAPPSTSGVIDHMLTTRSKPADPVGQIVIPDPALPPPRTPSAPPIAVPISHSQAYLQQDNAHSFSSSSSSSNVLPHSQPSVLSSQDVALSAVSRSHRLQSMDWEEEEGEGVNAVQRLLRRVDRSLDEIERSPQPIQKAVYDISRSPVGQATTERVGAAVSATIGVGREAVKAAVPIGAWAVKEGGKMALSLVSKALAEGAAAKRRREDKSRK